MRPKEHGEKESNSELEDGSKQRKAMFISYKIM